MPLLHGDDADGSLRYVKLDGSRLLVLQELRHDIRSILGVIGVLSRGNYGLSYLAACFHFSIVSGKLRIKSNAAIAPRNCIESFSSVARTNRSTCIARWLMRS
jgi:hypothetical protein